MELSWTHTFHADGEAAWFAFTYPYHVDTNFGGEKHNNPPTKALPHKLSQTGYPLRQLRDNIAQWERAAALGSDGGVDGSVTRLMWRAGLIP